jgi:hypothetical protein
METGGSLPCSKESAIGSYTDAVEFIPRLRKKGKDILVTGRGDP